MAQNLYLSVITKLSFFRKYIFVGYINTDLDLASYFFNLKSHQRFFLGEVDDLCRTRSSFKQNIFIELDEIKRLERKKSSGDGAEIPFPVITSFVNGTILMSILLGWRIPEHTGMYLRKEWNL